MENEENKKQFLEDTSGLRIKLEEAEETISAIQGGRVDAIVVSGLHGEQVFTLIGAERAYRVLIETMNEGAASLNRKGLIIYCNQRLSEMFKTPLEKVIGSPLRQFVRASDLPVFDNLMEKGLQESGKGEVALINSNGTVLPVLLSVSSMQRDNENICGITVTDLTAQKHIEDELRRHRDHLEELVKDRTNELLESSELNRQVIESAQEGIIVYGTDLKYRIWNSFMELLTGLSSGDVLGRHPLEVFPFLLEAGVVAGIEKALAGEVCEAKRFQFHIPKTGRSGWASEISAPLKNAKGEIVGVIATVRDITERKQAEQDLQAASVIAHNEKTRSEAIMASMGEGLSIQNTDFIITYQNTVQKELIGEHLGEHCYTAYENLDHVCEGCPVAMAYGDGGIHKTERAITTGNGTLYVEITASPLRDMQGNIVAGIEIVRDITERRNMEQQLRQSQKMEAIGTLAGGVAHDFNNILSAILGYSHLIINKLKGNDPIHNYVEEIIEASKRAAVLTNGLLTFCRKQVVNMTTIDLSEVIKGNEAFLRRLISEDIEFKITCTGDPLAVLADRGQIEQVIMNLVTNARDAMTNGGKLSIETQPVTMDQEFIETHGYGKAGAYVMFSVSDSGVGMDKETLLRIFEPFFTTKDQGHGTGLGLSMAFGIVKKHDGFINVYSEPGTGTIFRIYLPREQATSLAGKIETREVAPLRGGTETILVGEDDAALLRMSTRILSHYGYRVIEAVNGQDAVNKFVEHGGNIDLVILDAIMPKKNGREACQEMRTVRPNLKVVFVSGYTRDIFTVGNALDGNSVFIQKPFSPDMLVTKVREMLDK